eukprot:m.124867 g.124867  ORF g.124867 m.124867 type:complete len:412 (+) comp22097_c0_seq1:127-1362(+)
MRRWSIKPRKKREKLRIFPSLLSFLELRLDPPATWLEHFENRKLLVGEDLVEKSHISLCIEIVAPPFAEWQSAFSTLGHHNLVKDLCEPTPFEPWVVPTLPSERAQVSVQNDICCGQVAEELPDILVLQTRVCRVHLHGDVPHLGGLVVRVVDDGSVGRAPHERRDRHRTRKCFVWRGRCLCPLDQVDHGATFPLVLEDKTLVKVAPPHKRRRREESHQKGTVRHRLLFRPPHQAAAHEFLARHDRGHCNHRRNPEQLEPHEEPGHQRKPCRLQHHVHVLRLCPPLCLFTGDAVGSHKVQHPGSDQHGNRQQQRPGQVAVLFRHRQELGRARVELRVEVVLCHAHVGREQLCDVPTVCAGSSRRRHCHPERPRAHHHCRADQHPGEQRPAVPSDRGADHSRRRKLQEQRVD